MAQRLTVGLAAMALVLVGVAVVATTGSFTAAVQDGRGAAPALASTTTGCFRLADILSAIARPTMSSGPPAADDTIILMGFEG